MIRIEDLPEKEQKQIMNEILQWEQERLTEPTEEDLEKMAEEHCRIKGMIQMHEKEVLREIVQGIFNIDTKEHEILDAILDRYTDNVYIGQFKCDDNYIHGTFNDDIVSINKESLKEMYDVFYEILN